MPIYPVGYRKIKRVIKCRKFRFRLRGRESVTAGVWDMWWMEAVGRVPRYYKVSQGIPKSIFKTNVTVVIIFYYTLTFIITALKVTNLVYK